MTSPSFVMLRNTGLFGAAILGLTTCNHPTGVLQLNQPYVLRSINGRALPYAVNGTPTGPAITRGSVTFLAAARAERAERRGQPNGGADSTITEWTQPGTYYGQLGRVIVRYDGWPPAQGGPPAAADTLEATASGGLMLRHAGLELKFCPGSGHC